jgi:hypothetical protein
MTDQVFWLAGNYEFPAGQSNSFCTFFKVPTGADNELRDQCPTHPGKVSTRKEAGRGRS